MNIRVFLIHFYFFPKTAWQTLTYLFQLAENILLIYLIDLKLQLISFFLINFYWLNNIPRFIEIYLEEIFSFKIK